MYFLLAPKWILLGCMHLTLETNSLGYSLGKSFNLMGTGIKTDQFIMEVSFTLSTGCCLNFALHESVVDLCLFRVLRKFSPRAVNCSAMFSYSMH